MCVEPRVPVLIVRTRILCECKGDTVCEPSCELCEKEDTLRCVRTPCVCEWRSELCVRTHLGVGMEGKKNTMCV